MLSRGWLFYFADNNDCQKFKDIAFFSEKMFNQAFVKYVLGSISLEQSKIQKVRERAVAFAIIRRVCVSIIRNAYPLTWGHDFSVGQCLKHTVCHTKKQESENLSRTSRGARRTRSQPYDTRAIE